MVAADCLTPVLAANAFAGTGAELCTSTHSQGEKKTEKKKLKRHSFISAISVSSFLDAKAHAV